MLGLPGLRNTRQLRLALTKVSAYPSKSLKLGLASRTLLASQDIIMVNYNYYGVDQLSGVLFDLLVTEKRIVNASAYQDIFSNFMLLTFWEQFAVWERLLPVLT